MKLQLIMPQNKCNICNGTEFIPGYGGRLHRGLPTRCKNCLSMERHRVVYSFYQRIPVTILSSLRTLQFSDDKSVNPSWFKSFEKSVYGKENSLDLMRIDRPNNIYDLVVCNHVLEHIKDDKQAISELLRITKPDGIVQISVPDPLYNAETRDWGFPDPKEWYHFRHYGNDILERLEIPLTNLNVLSTIGIDIPTGRKEIIYWFSQNENTITKLKGYFRGAQTNKEVEASTAQVEASSAQIEALTAQVEALHQSWSWKITSPLRSCRRFFLKHFPIRFR